MLYPICLYILSMNLTELIVWSTIIIVLGFGPLVLRLSGIIMTHLSHLCLSLFFYNDNEAMRNIHFCQDCFPNLDKPTRIRKLMMCRYKISEMSNAQLVKSIAKWGSIIAIPDDEESVTFLFAIDIIDFKYSAISLSWKGYKFYDVPIYQNKRLNILEKQKPQTTSGRLRWLTYTLDRYSFIKHLAKRLGWLTSSDFLSEQSNQGQPPLSSGEQSKEVSRSMEILLPYTDFQKTVHYAIIRGEEFSRRLT